MSTPPVEEREEPQAPPRRWATPKIGAPALVVGAGLLIALTFYRNGREEPQPEPDQVARIPSADFGDLRTVLAQAIAQTPPPPPAAAPPPPPPPPAAPAFAPAGPAANSDARMVSYAVRQRDPAASSRGAASSSEPDEGSQRTSVAYRGQQVPGLRAGQAIDTSLTLMPGIYGCILDTAVSSERAGPFQCHTDDVIRSPLGVPLMGKGTTIIGEYDGNVRQGQSRVPGIVVTAWTPEGIPVPLGAIVADELGRVGMPGRVNRHVAERFGGAFALLLGQGAMDAARAALTQGNGNSNVNLNTGSIQGVASDVLRGTIGIQNTVEKNQGEAIAFFVTKPVSFDDAIRLRVR